MSSRMPSTSGRHLDHGGTVLLEVEESPGVERGVVPGQHQRLGIAHLLGDHDLVGPGEPEVPLPLADVVHRDRRDHVDEDLHGARPVHVVVDLLRRVADRHPVEELERADAGVSTLSGVVMLWGILVVFSYVGSLTSTAVCAQAAAPSRPARTMMARGLGFHLSSPDYLGNRNLIENCRVQSGAWSGRTTLW
jgi:hypothetical protein